MNLSLRDIKYILTIEEEGSVTKAAQVLHIAQPSLSQALKRIEEEIRVRLFVRTQNQMIATPEGIIFIESCREILEYVKNMEEKIELSAKMSVNTVRLGMTFFMGSYFFPKIQAMLIERVPDAVVHLVEDSSIELEKKLIHREIDLALLPTPLVHNEIQFQVLHSTPMLLLLPKDDDLNRFSYTKSAEGRHYLDIHLANHRDFLVGKSGQRVRLINEMIFKKAGISPGIVFCSQNIDTIKRVTAEGGGISIVPEFYVKRLGGMENIICYNLEPEYSVDWVLAATYLDHASLSSPCMHIINIVKELIKIN